MPCMLQYYETTNNFIISQKEENSVFLTYSVGVPKPL